MKKYNFFICKFLPILSIVLILFTFICTSSFAAFDVKYNDTTYHFPDLPEEVNGHQYVITTDGKNGQQLFIFPNSDSNTKLYLVVHPSWGNYISSDKDNFETSIIYYTLRNSEWTNRRYISELFFKW